MTSAFFGLQTSLRGLLTQQQALDVTGHNIANANTQGYSRQEAVLEPTRPYIVPSNSVNTGAGAQLGSGVDVAAIRRIRDQFLDLLEIAVLLAVLDDARCGLFANAGQRREFRRRRGVDVDCRGRGRLGGRRGFGLR